MYYLDYTISAFKFFIQKTTNSNIMKQKKVLIVNLKHIERLIEYVCAVIFVEVKVYCRNNRLLVI
jgi:hypothetical protein